MPSRILLGLSAFALAIALGGCAAAAGGTGGGSGDASVSPTASPSASPSGGSSGTSSASPRSILGTWQLASGTDTDGAFTPGGAVVILKLDGAKSGGQGPCNSYGATETGSTTGPISIRVGIRTMMACAEAARNVIESRYFAALGKVTQASLANGELSLTGGGVRLVFNLATP